MGARGKGAVGRSQGCSRVLCRPLPSLISDEALPLAAENLLWPSRSVDCEDGRSFLSIGDGHREIAVWPALSLAPISALELGACQHGQPARMAWLHKLRVPGFAFASASTCFHPIAVPAVRGLRASPRQFAHVRRGRSPHASESCDPGLSYGFPAGSAPSPDWFPAAAHDGRPPPVAPADESVDSKAADRFAGDTGSPSLSHGLPLVVSPSPVGPARFETRVQCAPWLAGNGPRSTRC